LLASFIPSYVDVAFAAVEEDSEVTWTWFLTSQGGSGDWLKNITIVSV